MYVITWDNAAEKAAGMGALATRVATHHTYDWAADVAEAGERTISDIARVDKGFMKAAVGKSATAMGGSGIAEAGYGLAQAAPFYTKFQEYGTRHGIQPMFSVAAGAIAMENEAQDSGMRMLANIAAEWDGI